MTTQIAVHPLCHVRVGEGLGPLVDQHIVVKGHVVHLIVRGESKGLRTNLHANGLSLGLGVNVSFVIENPVVVLVAIQRDHVFSSPVAAIDFLQKVKPRVVPLRRAVRSIPIEIEERSQIIVLVLARIAVGRIFIKIGWIRVPPRKIDVRCSRSHRLPVLTMTLGIRSVAHTELVVFLTCQRVGFCSSIIGQWTRPKIIACVSVPHGGQLQLLVRANPAQPKGTTIHHRDALLLGHEVGTAVNGTVVPQRSAVFNERPNVVPFQIAQCCRRRACGRSGLQLRGWCRYGKALLVLDLGIDVQRHQHHAHKSQLQQSRQVQESRG